MVDRGRPWILKPLVLQDCRREPVERLEAQRRLSRIIITTAGIVICSIQA